jgi:hypothetical protein
VCFCRQSSTDGELIAAVQRLRLSSPTLKAKEVHAALSSEQQWADVTLSDVRRACSKATKMHGVTHLPEAHEETLDVLRSRLQTCMLHGFDTANEVSEALCAFIAHETLTGVALFNPPCNW